MSASTWSAEDEQVLRLLWRAISARRIAALLGVTRNAVIGKADRLGIGRDAPRRMKRGRSEARRAA